jgi:DNA invertase Pin-like site-specific DNA recombinase
MRIAETRPPTRPGDKVQDRHRERLAIIYVRQSSAQQVERHQESTRLQYAMAERAAEFGWPAERIVTIDEDLGLSGASAAGRPGFQRLVAEVGLNHVGLVLGIEVSRLARSCRDWYQLLEVCAIFDTLLADADGVYDPGFHNDRLLLGLKGTMSEAELHVLKARMHQGRIAKAKRGELVVALPRGFVRNAAGAVVLDPDEQVQDTIRLVFDLFERRRSVMGVLRWLAAHDVRLPDRVRGGEHKGELVWRQPNRATVADMIRHPAYAGTFVYGRRQVDPRRQRPDKPFGGRVFTRDRQRWMVLLQDRWPGYIDWAQFERNQEQMAKNRAVHGGIPLGGPALLSGLVRCGRCGRRMTVVYRDNGRKPRYSCVSMNAHYGAPLCQSLGARAVDERVTARIMEALAPSSLEVSLQLAEDLELERLALHRQWQAKLERARYEADLARRRYEAVDPANRLVARALERAWEEALTVERTLAMERARFAVRQPAKLTPDELEAIRRLTADIPALWQAPTTTAADRQTIARLMLEQAVVTVEGDGEKVEVACHWAGGARTVDQVIRPVRRFRQMSAAAGLIERLRALRREGFDCATIAARLNAEGWRPPRAERFTAATVSRTVARYVKDVAVSRARPAVMKEADEVTLAELAEALGVPRETAYRWVVKGWVAARQVTSGRQKHWLVRLGEEDLRRLRARQRSPSSARAISHPYDVQRQHG